MITLGNVNVQSVKGKGLLFGFSLDSGDLASVVLVERAESTMANNAGWLAKAYPPDSDTETFKLADAFAWLAVNVPGWGRLTCATLTFNDAGKLTNVQEI